MRVLRLAWPVGLVLVHVLVIGCGKPTLPGRQFSGERPDTTSAPPVTSPLPEEPYYAWGDADAKTRVLAFYPIDEDHAWLMDLLKDLVEKHPGKLYVRYVDYRTPEGNAIFTRAGGTGRAVLIDGENAFDIETENRTYTVDFVGEMGRYWTEEDLKVAISQAVERAH